MTYDARRISPDHRPWSDILVHQRSSADDGASPDPDTLEDAGIEADPDIIGDINRSGADIRQGSGLARGGDSDELLVAQTRIVGMAVGIMNIDPV
jgi:hypothetical protein